MGMNNSQARVIDPVLTTVARGYKNAAFVGHVLFPKVDVNQRGGKILSFGKEDFMLYATGRAPGENTKRVSFGYLGAPYALDSHSLEGKLPIEHLQEGLAVPGIDLGSMTVNKTQNIIELRLEKQRADVARNAASYPVANKITLAGASQWNDPASDPVKIVEDGKEAVRKKVGKRANTAVIGAAVFSVLKNHPKVVDRMKYTGRDVATPELLASLFGLDQVVVGDAVYANDAGDFADVWGNDVILAYTEIGSVAEQGNPSFGYTYQLAGYPIVEESYFDRNAKSFIYPVTDEVAPVIAGAEAGYLIQNAVA
jgi:hypothetical protein